jgi:hypothetical protein
MNVTYNVEDLSMDHFFALLNRQQLMVRAHFQLHVIISFHLSDFVIMLTPKHTCWLWFA